MRAFFVCALFVVVFTSTASLAAASAGKPTNPIISAASKVCYLALMRLTIPISKHVGLSHQLDPFSVHYEPVSVGLPISTIASDHRPVPLLQKVQGRTLWLASLGGLWSKGKSMEVNERVGIIEKNASRVNTSHTFSPAMRGALFRITDRGFPGSVMNPAILVGTTRMALIKRAEDGRLVRVGPHKYPAVQAMVLAGVDRLRYQLANEEFADEANQILDGIEILSGDRRVTASSLFSWIGDLVFLRSQDRQGHLAFLRESVEFSRLAGSLREDQKLHITPEGKFFISDEDAAPSFDLNVFDLSGEQPHLIRLHEIKHRTQAIRKVGDISTLVQSTLKKIRTPHPSGPLQGHSYREVPAEKTMTIQIPWNFDEPQQWTKKGQIMEMNPDGEVSVYAKDGESRGKRLKRWNMFKHIASNLNKIDKQHDLDSITLTDFSGRVLGVFVRSLPPLELQPYLISMKGRNLNFSFRLTPEDLARPYERSKTVFRWVPSSSFGGARQ